jgi:hypothetical protein
VANPGCYPTATQLGFLPLVEAGCIDLDHLIADAKSGVSGAGRKAEIGILFSEASDNFKAYGVPGHRHLPEIRQGLARAAGRDVGLTFVPHLTPMIRGIHSTLYARITRDEDFQACSSGATPTSPSWTCCRRNRIPRRARCAPPIPAASPCIARRAVTRWCPFGHRQPGQGGGRAGGAEHEPDVWSRRMFGSFASSRLALTLRRLRGRFGISAPRVAIRTHLPWYWRALSVIVVLSGVSLALAGWIYDAGRRFAGFHQVASEHEIAEMRERLAKLESELEGARKVANSSESRLRIESTAQERLAAQIKALEEENTRLKADLATFESLAGEPGRQVRTRDQPAADCSRRRRTVPLSPSAGPNRRQKGQGIQRHDSARRHRATRQETVMMQFPAAGDPAAGQYQVNFRHFRRLEGTSRWPPRPAFCGSRRA